MTKLDLEVEKSRVKLLRFIDLRAVEVNYENYLMAQRAQRQMEVRHAGLAVRPVRGLSVTVSVNGMASVEKAIEEFSRALRNVRCVVR